MSSQRAVLPLLELRDRLRVLVEDGHLVPSASIVLAIEEPTRPQPTIRTNICRTLHAVTALREANRPPADQGATPSRAWIAAVVPGGAAVRITRHGAFSST